MTFFGFVRRLLKEQPLRFSLAVLALAFAGLLEGVGVAALVPLLDLMGGSRTPTDTIGRVLVAVLGVFRIPYNLMTVLLFVVFFVLALAAMTLAQQKIVWGSIVRFEAQMRERLYEAIFNAGWPFFISERTGDLTNALTVEAGRGSLAYSYLNQMLGAALVIVIYVALALVISWQMTIVIVVVGGAVALSLRRRVLRGTRYGAAVSNLNAELQNEALENISGAKLVKGCAAEDVTRGRFSRLVERLATEQYRMNMNQAWVKAFFDSGSLTAVLLGAYAAVAYFHMQLASLVVFLLIFYRVSPRLSTLQTLQHSVLSYLPGVDSVDARTARAAELKERTGTRRPGALERAIVFDDLTFEYEPGHPVLHRVDLTVGKGRTTAIVGPSGSGKTTIVDLIMRLILPTTGSAEIDGIPMADLDVADWRRRIGYVAQDAVMFHTTVAENIAWGRPGATIEDVHRAARLADAEEFIVSLPSGFDTVVGDRGLRVSGGQRQRIALARALVRDPEILILDEATSALDAESESKIMAAVEQLAKSTTIVLVTHRLASVRSADMIYFMENGVVVENGAWDQVSASGHRFAELKALQELS